MKQLKNTDLFGGDGKLLGYVTDDGVNHVKLNYKNGKPAYITIVTPGSGNHAVIGLTRLDEVIKMLLAIRKELH